MNDEVVAELIQILDLETLEKNLFRGQNIDIGSGSVFGGQVVSQALIAAYRTIPTGLTCHSLHCYFIRPGDVNLPLIFQVENTRDGRSFSTRRVVVIQKGRAVFDIQLSFQVAEEGLQHQAATPPKVPAPDDLPDEYALRTAELSQIKAPLPHALLKPRAVDMRPVDPVGLLRPEQKEPAKQVWFRINGAFDDTPIMHQAMLAYASDFGFVSTGMLPHGLSYADPRVQVASLDHSLWFHQPFKAQEWLLYSMESPFAASARNFNRGQIFQGERLVVSVAQEGLMRRRPSQD